MRRRFVHALAWTLATLTAVTVSWLGVRLMLDSTSDRPHAVPLSGGAPSARESSEPPSVGTATERPPRPSPTPTRTPDSPSAAAGSEGAEEPEEPERTESPAGANGSRAAGETAQGDRPAGSGAVDVQTFPVAGGRVTFEMAGGAAELVSATPQAGWQMQIWEQTSWIRVDFVAGDRRTSVICTWHDSAPRVETNEYPS
ncbi:hypothetical protein [Streptomyces synnematoformans]|uniref:Secreted protein n=1 Tax=Streptomyces synnematoformans TaxID=415721 RepID=A0ABN2A0E9_9ACTN